MSKPSFYLGAVGVWFVFLVIAFSLGTLRELAITPLLGERGAVTSFAPDESNGREAGFWSTPMPKQAN